MQTGIYRYEKSTSVCVIFIQILPYKAQSQFAHLLFANNKPNLDSSESTSDFFLIDFLRPG